MIKYGLFLVFIGLIIFEGVSGHPGSRRNDTRIGSITHKRSRNMARRSMYRKKSEYNSASSKENSLESIDLAIDTGVKKFMEIKNKPDVVDYIAKTLLDFAKKTASNPTYRSKGEAYGIKPEVVRFKDDKPSVLLEVNSESIVNGLRDLLKSKTVHKLIDQFSRKAAVVYRSIRQELGKDKGQASYGQNERDEQQ